MRRTLCLFAVAGSLAVTSLASADAAPNPEAVKHFLAGKSLRDENKCDLAIKELELSISIEDSIGARYNLGVCYEKTNKRLAYANYQRALVLAKDKRDDREREIAAQRYAFLKANPPIRLALPQRLPPDTRVTVDGDPVPQEDLAVETLYFPKVERETYAVEVTAPGYDDVHISVAKTAMQDGSLFPVTMKKHEEKAPRPAPPPPGEPKWGPYQFLGLGLIALGAAGITYASASAVAYDQRRRNFFENHTNAAGELSRCRRSGSNCSAEDAAELEARHAYDDNEADARSAAPLWLTAGIGGLLAIGGGIALIVYAPRSVSEPASAPQAATKPTFTVVPTFGARQQGMSLVGTF